MDIYKDNHAICSMIIYSPKKNGKITGRALLWKIPTGETFMDRVYADDSTQEMFVEYAKSKGFIYRNRQTFQDKDIIVVDNKVVTKLMEITLVKPITSYKYLPYFDTFTFDAGDNCLSNTF